MSTRFSLYLDLARFIAALIVFISHFAYARFTEGTYLIIREWNLGSDAVVFFFVLSGLVIAYTTEIKDKTLGQYSFNRMTRLFSVIVPALILTIILDHFGQRISPESYDGWWYNDTPAWEQMARGMSFSNQWFGQNYRIGSNGPMWSLSYEAAYYIVFGLMFYYGGFKKYLLLLPLLFIFGISIMALFPVWLIGLWAYSKIKEADLPKKYIWHAIILPPLVYVLFIWMGLPNTLLLATKLLLGVNFVNFTLGFANEFVWNFIIAVLVAVHLIGMAAHSRDTQNVVSPKFAKLIRWSAGATFTIYVVHYPLLQFVDAVLPSSSIPMLRHAIMFFLILLLCFVFAEFSERRLKWLRNRLSPQRV